ncbi:MAG: helix-turn-helix domain-containing protein [Nanoarchaeota archaeon]
MDTNCTLYRTADFIGKRWTLLILLEIYKGERQTKRYSQIKSSLPQITSKILSTRLKELEKEGMVRHSITAESFPIVSEYTLTKSGEEFVGIIQSMKTWALKWNLKNKPCQSADCRNCPMDDSSFKD